MSKYKPLVLIIVDGWGISENTATNAIAAASTPNLDSFLKKYPYTQLKASGIDVGLPEGTPGNSEIGHLNLGAGRVVYSDLTRINQVTQDKSFFNLPQLLEAFHAVQEKKTKLHFIGLLSDGRIHSHIDHLYALLELAKQQELKKVFVHAIMDGRDTLPKSGMQFIESAETKMKELGVGKIASVIGRYYAMDRNSQWERVQQTYDLLTVGKGLKFTSATRAVQYAYKHKETDEYLSPSLITNRNQEPVATIEDNDVVIFFNFRGDRLLELVASFVHPEFNQFKREKVPNVRVMTMTPYDDSIPVPAIFQKQDLKHSLGEIISTSGLIQLRIAETERYTQVTYFFNCMIEIPFPNEDRKLVHSPKVDSYDLKPEMSARPVTEEVCARIQSGKYEFILLTYANPDMVANTGNFEATKKAVEVVDECIGKVVETTLAQNGIAIIASTHGNADAVNSEIRNPQSAIGGNPVPFILIGYDKSIKLHQGILADVAPTLLELLGIPQPAEMTGKSLISKSNK